MELKEGGKEGGKERRGKKEKKRKVGKERIKDESHIDLSRRKQVMGRGNEIIIRKEGRI